MLKRFAGAGVSAVILTPHVSASELTVDPDDPLERREAAVELLRRVAPPTPVCGPLVFPLGDPPMGRAMFRE